MGIQDGVHHRVLADLFGAGFHHHDGVLGSGHGDVHIAAGVLVLAGVQDELAVDSADHHRGGGARPRDLADGDGDGGTDHGGEFGGIVGIHRQGLRHHLHVVAHSLGERGPEGPVDQAAGQGRFFGGPAFTLDKAAGDLADRVLLFLKIHGQGEEVHTLAGGLGGRRVHEHHGIAVADQGAAARLLGIPAEFQCQRSSREFH